MPLSVGTRLGVYEVTAEIGAGGMGEVYRARDTQLKREVALKVLPEAFAQDPDRLARFQREAELLATLNHPNIAAVYGLDKTEGVSSIVLELVEGATLAERIGRGGSSDPPSRISGESKDSPLPLDEALAIARQIADALEAAHEKGVIHRDLKPANIKVRPDGTVKVLDFGLAKAFDPTPGAGRSSSVSMSPTLTAATGIGVILGTAAYMAPEQARGKSVDKRADIWAFGCVLYEMLAGRRAFGGEEVSDTLAFVITKDIEWTALPSDTPLNIRRLLRRCLEKDPKRRIRDIADARIELDEPLEPGPSTTGARPTTPDLRQPTSELWWRRALPAVAVVVASALTGLGVWIGTRPAPATPPPVQRFPLTLPASAAYVGEAGGELAISPDGQMLVYAAIDGDKRLLHLRRLDQIESQPIRGTDDAFNPFFSPDGEWIGFFTGGGTQTGKLKKVAVRGGPPLTLADSSVPTGAWLPNDTIVFTRAIEGRWLLFGMPAAGGTAGKLIDSNAEKKEVRHGWPEVLPGGNALLFSISVGSGSFEDSRIAVLSLASGEYHTVVEQGYHARFVPSGLASSTRTERDQGHLIYMLSGNLMAVPFDLRRLQTTGPSVPIIEGVRGRSTTGEVGFAVSRTGSLIYAPGTTSTASGRALVWVDRSGHETPIAAPLRGYTIPRLSPDGKRVALDIRDQEFDIWTWDLARANLTRLTFARETDGNPVWTPDGQRIFFASQRAGAIDNIYWQSADGTGQPERLTESSTRQFPEAVSPDGKRVLFVNANPKTIADVGMLSVDDRKVAPLIQSVAVEQNPEISPDGRWIAYQSNESGVEQIYVRPFPAVDGGRWQVSTTGGTRPAWARSGRELFYLVYGSGGVRMMAVAVESGPTFAAGNPKMLFEGRYFGTPADTPARTYDVSADGKQFLMIKTAASDTAATTGPSFVFVLNWFSELRRLAPPAR